jgi:ATP-dependent HslUV protease ATP-binding subunit HslU
MSLSSQKGLFPQEIVTYLDRYVVGQDKAKRAVAVALRNRMRRRCLPEEMAKEISPRNIIMVGPTGVGKTEIARRLARLVDAPFSKVEATKFTEVGYVGRDVESMIRDLVESSVQIVKARKVEEVQEEAALMAEERILDALLPVPKKRKMPSFFSFGEEEEEPEPDPSFENDEKFASTRARLKEMLQAGRMEDREVEVQITESSRMGIPLVGGGGMDEMGMSINEMLGGLLPKKTKKKKMKIREARRILQAEEAERLVDLDAVTSEALEKAQEEGIVFLDELDKVASSEGRGSGPDVSREGVQRDLLPIVEGTSVQTKYGPVQTDHILFIAAGAFHKVKPSDLVPELQGRFPIRVELNSLQEEDLFRILKEPEHSLIKQYKALLETEDVEVTFQEEALREIARYAAAMNREMENIGARRLHTMMELLLEDLNFRAPQVSPEDLEITPEKVRHTFGDIAENEDMRKYLL